MYATSVPANSPGRKEESRIGTGELRVSPDWSTTSMRKRPGAVITIVHNESVFLPIFLRYYSQFFDEDDIYVIDHDSTDGSTTDGRFVRIPVTHETVDHRWLVRTVQAWQHELVGRYHAVIAVDVDEIVAPHPDTGDLGDYLERFEGEFVNCFGVEVLHRKDVEPPLDLRRPILEQRGYWFPDWAYCKPALASGPMEWFPGFHLRRDGGYQPDPNLYLIHLHRMDFDLCLERHRARRRIPWNQTDLDSGWAVHNRIVDEQEFTRWFYEESGMSGVPIETEPIPEVWKQVV
jgi:hypothetical protein